MGRSHDARGNAGGRAAATPATAVLQGLGIRFVAHEYAADPRESSYGAAAARALGVDPARLLKALVATLDGAPSGSPGLVVAVVPSAGHLDLRALARTVGAKRAAMADPAVAQRSSGYVVGGISPLGHRRPLPTVVDASVLTHETVLVSGGRRGLSVELAPGDLVTACRALVAPIAAP